MVSFPLFLALLCPFSTLALTNVHGYTLPEEEMGRYHGDHTCNRHGYNTFKEKMQRHLTYQKFKPIGFSAVPNQRTVMCPETVQDLHTSTQMTGYDTVWIVENTSSDPVVLSYINPDDGIEYSAINAKITPPQSDQDAILQPGQWRALYTWEGHVFFARQLLQDASGGGGANKLGPVLLQHRTGLIPIGMNAQDLICPVSTASRKPVDPEPIVNGAIMPAYDRTPSRPFRMCNTIDLGFRNMANCPLHGYYVQRMPDVEVEKLQDYQQVEHDTQKPVYQEHFKFHLGMNSTNPDDFMWGWDSATKFEGTFVGHSFAFRSAADPNVLVQTYTLRPTRIPDCPNLKNKPQVNRVTSVGMAAAVVLPTGIPKTFTNATDTIGMFTKAWNINGSSTRGRRRMLAPYSVDETIAVLAS